MGPLGELMKAAFRAASAPGDDDKRNHRIDKVRTILDRARKDFNDLA